MKNMFSYIIIMEKLFIWEKKEQFSLREISPCSTLLWRLTSFYDICLFLLFSSAFLWSSKTWPITLPVKYTRPRSDLMREHSNSGWGVLALIRTKSHFVFQPLQMSREPMGERQMEEMQERKRGRVLRTFENIDTMYNSTELTVGNSSSASNNSNYHMFISMSGIHMGRWVTKLQKH